MKKLWFEQSLQHRCQTVSKDAVLHHGRALIPLSWSLTTWWTLTTLTLILLFMYLVDKNKKMDSELEKYKAAWKTIRETMSLRDRADPDEKFIQMRGKILSAACGGIKRPVKKKPGFQMLLLLIIKKLQRAPSASTTRCMRWISRDQG